MNPQLKVWGRRSAFNVQKVLWTLDELELGYELTELGGRFGGLDGDTFRRMNPHGRVPVLADDGFVVWESHTIIRYLAATHGARRLWVPDAQRRSQCERWMDWSQATLQPAFMTLFWGYFRTPEDRRDARAIDQARTLCAEHFAVLDRHLRDHRYLAGDRFSMADIPAGTSLYRYLHMGASVAEPPHVLAWYERLCERQAFRDNVMVPFEELRGRLAF